MGGGGRGLGAWLRGESVQRQGANALWMLAARMAWIATAATVGIYVARRYGPRAFGEFHYALSLTGMFSIVVSLSVESLVIRKLVAEPEAHLRTLGSFAALRLASFAGMAVALGGTLLATGASRSTSALCLVIATGYVGFVLEGPALFFQANVRSKLVAIPQLLACGVNSSLRLCAAYWLLPLTVLAVAEASIALVSFGGALLLYWRVEGSPARWLPDRGEMTSLLRAGLPLGLSGIFTVVDARIDALMLGWFLGSDAVGQYAVASRIVENWNLVASVLTTAFLPALVSAKAESPEAYDATLHRIYFGMFYGMAALALLTTVVSTPTIRFLFGAAFRPAAAVLELLVWSSLGATLTYVFGQWAITEQRPGMVAAAVGSGLVAKIGLNLLLLARWQTHGVALATTLAGPLGLAATLLVSQEGRGHLGSLARMLFSTPSHHTCRQA
jgi:O-antigen/teichoic acid export membrane protein